MTFSFGLMRKAAHVAGLVAGVFLATAGSAQTLQPWMSTEVGDAWAKGYKGQGASITVVDDFTSSYTYSGQFDGTQQALTHGQWTNLQASLVAPMATMYQHDFYSGQAVTLKPGFDVLNLSYGMMAPAGYRTIRWASQEASIISMATYGHAVVVKAAGNESAVIGKADSSGTIDYLGRDLIGKSSALFVGALDRNGTTTNKATLAWYSNRPGSNSTVQNQFLMVGVEGDKTGLYGTSFAAPIVAGYAAIVSSKFTTATATQVRNQLLNTARTDTIAGYSRSVHGKGEASLTRALAPTGIK